MPDGDRFKTAVRRFDEAHQRDPRRETIQGVERPWSVHYHERLAHWVRALDPDPPDALLLAANCQHIRRWEIPRSDYEEGRSGYKRWRSALARFHAEKAREIMREAGYEEETIQRVEGLLLKLRLKHDPEVQRFEDAICLVFLENEFAEFSGKHDEAKMIDIVQKTWAKMSEAGHAAALELAAALPERARAILEKALA